MGEWGLVLTKVGVRGVIRVRVGVRGMGGFRNTTGVIINNPSLMN